MKYDSDVQRDVQAALRWEPGINDSSKIGVAVKDGVVTLTGVVNSYTEKSLAEKAAKRVYGVNGLAIELEVNLPSSAKRTDTEIARTAKNILDWDSSVPTDSVQVTVEDGRVTLEGNLDWQYQRSRAEDDVYGLTGVKGVSNEIVMKPAVEPSDVKAKIEAALKRSALLDAGTYRGPGQRWKGDPDRECNLLGRAQRGGRCCLGRPGCHRREKLDHDQLRRCGRR